ncbi:MAG: hypothetical protein K8U57_01690 [Planctomycetes bacterium]|nr:hypothetical protein [Planctomycetota bacterium]
MKQLHIQLQPGRSPELDLAEAVAKLRSVMNGARVTEGEDDVRYVNVDFWTGDPSGLWESLQKLVQSVPGLARAAIVVCEGEHGWDDYLLLHHFDPHEAVDPLR